MRAVLVKADLCHLCPELSHRGIIRKREIKMIEVLRPDTLRIGEEVLQLRVCRSCLTRMLSMLKRSPKK